MTPFTIYSVRKWTGVIKEHLYVQTDCGCMIFDGQKWFCLNNKCRAFNNEELSQLNDVAKSA